MKHLLLWLTTINWGKQHENCAKFKSELELRRYWRKQRGTFRCGVWIKYYLLDYCEICLWSSWFVINKMKFRLFLDDKHMHFSRIHKTFTKRTQSTAVENEQQIEIHLHGENFSSSDQIVCSFVYLFTWISIAT